MRGGRACVYLIFRVNTIAIKMKRIGKILLLLIIAFLIFAFSACNSYSGNLDNGRDPIQITDGAGRQVSFENPAQSVATTWGGSVAPYLYALGVGDRIIATNNKTGIHQACIPNIDKIPSVGSWNLDKEVLAQLSPDVFIHGWAATEQLDAANEVRIKSIGIKTNSFDDVADTLYLLGQVFGVENRATYVTSYCDSILNLIQNHTASIIEDEKPVVLVMAEETGCVASDTYNTIEQMISIAGGITCVPPEIAEGTNIVNVGLETIFTWNPDYLFLQSVYSELSAEEIMSDFSWQAMNAVNTGNVYAIPCEFDTWSSASPSSVLGTLYMSITMYPDLYYDIDFDAIVIDFYHDVYGLDVTMEMLGQS